VSRFVPGDLISGKYRIVRLIGDGGMGVVYEARHEVLGSGVALKFLHTDLAKRPGLPERFMQEARVSATIQSPHVTHVTDVDTARDGSPYLVMELLSGQSLQALLDRLGKLEVDQAVDYGLQILAGLEAAHVMGVVHRDMKPDNVFVTSTSGGPLLKLIDFGIAKLRASSEFTKGLTRAGVVMGTPEYMAPEQLVSAHTTDHRADIYSVGVMLFEMLSGCRPADGDDADIIVAAVEAGRVRNLRELEPSLPDGLIRLVERATLPSRDARFDNAAQMRLALAHFAGQLSHAGRLAAVAGAPPLAAPSAAPAPSQLPAVVHAATVPKTLPPDGPPLSLSQLGSARTSISEGGPPPSQLPRLMTGTAMAAPILAGPAPYGPPPQALPAAPVRRSRSGALVFALVIAVLGGGAAVGFAAYRAAERGRTVIPPLPEAVALAPSATLPLEPLTPDQQPPASSTDVPQGVQQPPSVTRPGPKATTAPTGGAAPPPTTVGDAGTPTNLPFPFPMPSTIQLPSGIPSSIQLPPGFPALPAGFPGVQQPAGTAAPTAASPTAAPPAPTQPAPAPTGTAPKKTSTRP
jgi:eukaryotic-like serine/threonine-protein kinase